MNKKKWIKRLLITLAVLLCGFAIFEIIVHVLMDSEMSSRDDWNIQLGERMYTSEERGRFPLLRPLRGQHSRLPDGAG